MPLQDIRLFHRSDPDKDRSAYIITIIFLILYVILFALWPGCLDILLSSLRSSVVAHAVF